MLRGAMSAGGCLFVVSCRARAAATSDPSFRERVGPAFETSSRADTTRHSARTTTDTMAAKTRPAVQRHAEHIEVHQDDMKEEEAEETLDESMDPLEESGHTVDSSDEDEPDVNTLEDMQRFAETFVGINKRFRLINRIGEGIALNHWLSICRDVGLAHFYPQEPSQQCTKPRT
jgi:hypothetical protein